MSDDTLLNQLIHRTKAFKKRTGLTSRQLGTLIGLTEQHVCDLLAFRKGLSAESTMRLLQVMHANKKEIDIKLGKGPDVLITHFQQEGKLMKMDDAWVPQEGGTDDPDRSDDDDGEEDDDEDTDDPSTEFLLAQIATHQKAISIIQSYLDKQAAAIPKARPNAQGVTSGPKTIVDSRSAGPQKAVTYCLPPVDQKRLLQVLISEREKLTDELELHQKVKEEFAAVHKVRVELAASKRK